MKSIVLLLAALTAAAAFAADPVPLFNGTLTLGREHRFVLATSEGKASSWLRMGESFEGYTISAYDAKAGVLDLERDGKIVRVTLVSDAAIANAPMPTPATLADAESVLKAMNFDVMMEKILAQTRKQQLAMVDRMATQMDRPGVDKEALGALQKKMIDEFMTALNPADMKKDFARIYSEVFTKEELQGLAAFYGTPLGQATSEKQPIVQEKISAAMMPRIMAAMPKMQQMAKEFALEQKAKMGGGGGAPAAPSAPKP